MFTREENELLTQVGPGTPGGEFQRRYWQPVALSQELPLDGAHLPVRLLGEDLVLFRDAEGKPGLLGIHCPHRGADLSYGRLEDGGLRCIYHGWLFDRTGQCLEQPGEPAGSTFHTRIRQAAYPCEERAGLILSYMGPSPAPLIPAYEFFDVAPEYYATSKVFEDCNYLQGNEGNIDPAHLSFLHRLSMKEDLNQSFNLRVQSPQIETEETDFGIRVYAIRPLDAERNYVRVTNFVLPNFSAVAGDAEGFSVNWHVPIDDTHHWRYGIRFNRYTPLERGRWGSTELTPDYRMARNRANRYLQNRDSMSTWAFAGLGKDFVLHDTAVIEGEGQVQDRTAEHLSYTDRAIVAARMQILNAIKSVEKGSDPPHVVRSQADNPRPDLFTRNDVVLPASVDWRHYWRSQEANAVLASTRGGRERAAAGIAD